MVGLAENKANSAPIELELELRLSLAKRYKEQQLPPSHQEYCEKRPRQSYPRHS